MDRETMDRIDRAAQLGETNNIALVGRYDVDHSVQVALSDPRLVRIKRIRYIGWSPALRVWDLSYCHGELDDGRIVRVQLLDGYQLDCGRSEGAVKRELYRICCAAGVNGKKLGIYDALSILPGY